MKLIKTGRIAIADLIMDWNIYPRHEVDRVRVNEYYSAMQAGARFPPIRVDIATKKIIDGFHRTETSKKAKAEEIEVEYYEFANEAEMVWCSINWNALHGLKLTHYDQGRCLNIGRSVGLSDEMIAQALCMTVEKITKMERAKVRIHASTGKPVEVKRVIADVTSGTVTQKQMDIQKPFNCMRADYYVARALDALTGDLLPVNEATIGMIEDLEAQCLKWLSKNRLNQAN